MRIVAGSLNVPKESAVKSAFAAAFPNETPNVWAVRTESGVSSHPTSGEEAIEGALNRSLPYVILKTRLPQE